MQNDWFTSSLAFVFIHHHVIVRLLTWTPPCTSALDFTFSGCAHYVVSLYISLFAAGEDGVSEPCDALQPNVGLHVRLCFPCACSSMSAPELWSCPLPTRAASLCLCVYMRERERDGSRDASIEDKDSFDHTGVSLMSCSSMSEHLRYHHRCGREWEASTRGNVSVYWQF